MATRIGSQDDLTRLKRAREAADRAYNDALTRVDRALPRRPALPDPPRAFDQRQLAPVNEAWRVAPDVERLLGSGWQRRLRAWVWDLVGPIVERQQHFNGVLVDHLNRTATAQVEGQQAMTAIIAALADYTGALEAFQSRLIQYVQQITPFVDTKDYEVAGVSRAMMSALDDLGDEMRRRAEAAVAREQRFARHVDELRTTVGQVQHGLLAMRRRLEGAASGEAAPAAGAGTKADLDATVDTYAYVGFENLYGGSRDEIRSRLVEYLPLFDGASDVLDVGCGRGEFLNLLRERDIRARGVDVNAEMVEECRARGLDASAGDALTHLDALEDESLGGLFAAQVVEHLQPDYLVRLLNVAGRKLRPGARIVLETINPRCWFAFFDAYIRDITHVRPLHPDTLTYLLGASGFQRTTVRYLMPYPDDGKLRRIPLPDGPEAAAADPSLAAAVEIFNGNVDRLNGLLFTHLDYAAIGERIQESARARRPQPGSGSARGGTGDTSMTSTRAGRRSSQTAAAGRTRAQPRIRPTCGSKP